MSEEGMGRYDKEELFELIESWIDENNHEFFDADTLFNGQILVIKARKTVDVCTFESECSSRETVEV